MAVVAVVGAVDTCEVEEWARRVAGDLERGVMSSSGGWSYAPGECSRDVEAEGTEEGREGRECRDGDEWRL